MKKMLVICFLFLIYSFSFSRVYVKGYYRKNGTYVQSHYRSSPKLRGRRSNYYYSSNSYYGGKKSNYYSSNSYYDNSYYDNASSKKNEFINLKENNTNDIIKNNDEILSNNTVENNDEILNNDILVQVSDEDIEKVKIYKVIEIIDNSGNSRIELKEESLSSVNLFDKTYIIIRNSN